ncbi:substrate-binding domain-containing protein [Microbacterium indicum]|uniref:substrate-binding domain-containing protein n=1 Tax=Microbacterium indicum TaxID=358100 RepID=UPI00040045EF|nr:substrate-binding domain-containing protein [Microbacterium indicum]
MDLTQRQERILSELKLHGSLSATDFADRMGISAMTVRRDLGELAERGMLRRVHGGAVPVDEPQRPERADVTASGHRPPPRSSAGPVPVANEPLFTFGFVVPDPGYYFPAIVDGAVERVQSLGGRLVLGISDYDAGRERFQVQRLIDRGVDGLLVTSATNEEFETFGMLIDSPVPVVVVERSLDDAIHAGALDLVRTDHAAGAVVAIRLFAELGHTHVGMVTFATPTMPHLRTGFDRAVRGLGLACGAEAVAQIDHRRGIREQSTAYLERAVAAGVTAVFVHSDRYAVEFVEAALAMGLSIPGDLSVVAYDDEVAALAAVPLTAVSPPKRDVGWAAVGMLFDRVSTTPERALTSRHLTLRPNLVSRRSTASPRS